MAELPDFLCVPSIGLFFKSHPPLFFLTFNQQSFVFYLFKYIYLFIFGCAGSSLLSPKMKCWGFLGSSAGKKIHLQCRRPRFDS